MFSPFQECTQKEVEGKQALAEARRQDSINQSRLNDISVRLEELKVGEKRFAEERLQLHSERKQLESLKSRQLCAGCKQPVSRNPYFSLSEYYPYMFFRYIILFSNSYHSQLTKY